MPDWYTFYSIYIRWRRMLNPVAITTPVFPTLFSPFCCFPFQRSSFPYEDIKRQSISLLRTPIYLISFLFPFYTEVGIHHNLIRLAFEIREPPNHDQYQFGGKDSVSNLLLILGNGRQFWTNNYLLLLFGFDWLTCFVSLTKNLVWLYLCFKVVQVFMSVYLN